MPSDITRKISERATAIARQLAPKKTGAGAAGLKPSSQEGEIGIHIPDDVIYMLYQNQGIQPRIMKELAGKTIPIRNPNGSISFRRATEDNIGKKKITSRNEKGQIITSRISWRYPGLKPKYFIEKSLQQATDEWTRSATGLDTMRMLDESEISYLMNILKGRE